MDEARVKKIINFNGQVKFIITTSSMFEKCRLYISARGNSEYSFFVQPLQINKTKAVFSFSVHKLNPKNIYYDTFFEYTTEEGLTKKQTVSGNSRIQRFSINLFHSKHQIVYDTQQKYIITEYFAVGGKLSLQIRAKDRYDSWIYKVKELVACILAPFVYWYYKDTKLIYEKFSNYARDNAFYYFANVQEHHPDKKLFYIVTKNSPDLANLLPYRKQVVYFMSVKHLLLILVSKYFIASEAKGHAYAWRHNQSIVRYALNRKPFVFLQHGVLGLKQVDNTFFASNRLNHADLFITSSEIEKNIVTDFLGYLPQNIAVTGLARWDNPEKILQEKKIFVMPTWRTQLELLSGEEFLKSDFYQAYSELLHSDRVKKVLHDSGYSLHFMMHPKFVRFEKYFQTDDQNVRVIHQSEIPLDKELKSSQLVITDYSSIMWDALYYSIPTVLFQFDQAEYLETQGSYLDFHEDLAGIIVQDPLSLVQKIENFVQHPETGTLDSCQKKYFSFVDQNNSDRITQAISKWENGFSFVPFYKRRVKKPETSQRNII